MGSKIVRFKREDIPRMTPEEVAALKAKLDDRRFVIDTSDIPTLTEEQWKDAKRRGLVRTAATRASNASVQKEETARPV
jgi:hypothetical protein